LDGHPLWGCGSGFGLVPAARYTTLSVRVRDIIWCLKNKRCENERTVKPKNQSKTMWFYLKIVFSQLGGLEQTYVRGLAESFLKLNLNIFRSKILVKPQKGSSGRAVTGVRGS